MTIEEMLTNLSLMSANTSILANDLVNIEGINQSNNKFIPLAEITRFIQEMRHISRVDEERAKTEEKFKTPVQKFLFIEDGTIDINELKEKLYYSNPEIKIVVYRQGANPPRLVDNKE